VHVKIAPNLQPVLDCVMSILKKARKHVRCMNFGNGVQIITSTFQGCMRLQKVEREFFVMLVNGFRTFVSVVILTNDLKGVHEENAPRVFISDTKPDGQSKMQKGYGSRRLKRCLLIEVTKTQILNLTNIMVDLLALPGIANFQGVVNHIR